MSFLLFSFPFFSFSFLLLLLFAHLSHPFIYASFVSSISSSSSCLVLFPRTLLYIFLVYSLSRHSSFSPPSVFSLPFSLALSSLLPLSLSLAPVLHSPCNPAAFDDTGVRMNWETEGKKNKVLSSFIFICICLLMFPYLYLSTHFFHYTFVLIQSSSFSLNTIFFFSMKQIWEENTLSYLCCFFLFLYFLFFIQSLMFCIYFFPFRSLPPSDVQRTSYYTLRLPLRRLPFEISSTNINTFDSLPLPLSTNHFHGLTAASNIMISRPVFIFISISCFRICVFFLFFLFHDLLHYLGLCFFASDFLSV